MRAAAARETTQKEKRKLSLEELRNKLPFVEFLAQYPDSESISLTEEYAEEIEQRYQAFENRTAASAELRQLFRQRHKQEGGVDLVDDDLRCVDQYITEEAVQTPNEWRHSLTTRGESTSRNGVSRNAKQNSLVSVARRNSASCSVTLK
jgi:hypothetical protein